MVCATVNASATAERLATTAVRTTLGDDVSAKLERRSGRAYDAVTLTCGYDTVQVLVNSSETTTVRVNGRQVVLPARAKSAMSRGGWRALHANDREKIQSLLELTHDPEAVIKAMIATQHEGLPTAEEIGDIYFPLAPGGCGIGGKCSDEAWKALMDLFGCGGALGTAGVNGLAQNYGAALFGGLLSIRNCAAWNESHENFTTCCGKNTRPGRPGDGDGSGEGDEPEDPEPCDGCLPPDMEGPNPPCCDSP
jgi:hypothetical protein